MIETMERVQKRWIYGALALALLLHLIVAWAMGWYRIPGLTLPTHETIPAGPFNVKRIEINPESLKSPQEDPIANLPAADPLKNPSQFSLDPNLMGKALQAPLPALSTPAVPEPNKVIAGADVTQALPFVESDTAKISAEISKVEPGTNNGPMVSAKLAQDLISATPGPAQNGVASGTPISGGGSKSKLPGFAELAPGFKTGNPNLSNLPDPVLLRLPSDVLFDFDSAKLKPDADALLSQAIGLITKYPEADIHVDGYSDSFGKSDYNLMLSQQRSEAVQSWFQEHIVQGKYRYNSQGHGSTNFIIPAKGSIDEQQPNRRVEILIQALK
jgi:OOP family OmpA-OmpF porin